MRFLLMCLAVFALLCPPIEAAHRCAICGKVLSRAEWKAGTHVDKQQVQAIRAARTVAAMGVTSSGATCRCGDPNCICNASRSAPPVAGPSAAPVR